MPGVIQQPQKACDSQFESKRYLEKHLAHLFKRRRWKFPFKLLLLTCYHGWTPEAKTHVTYTRHLSLNKVLLRRASERSGLGFVGQRRSVFMCRGECSLRHLMAINNSENEIVRRKGEGGSSALLQKQGNSLNIKADALQDKQRLALSNFYHSFFFLFHPVLLHNTLKRFTW